MNCPHCDFENIAGADTCERCGQSIVDDPQPATDVEQALMSDVIGKLNPKEPIIVAPETSLKDVLDLLVKHSIGCVLVVADEELVGIFSERDALVKVGSRFAELAAHPVSEFMTQNPDSLYKKTMIAFAVQRMEVGGFRHLPIVDKAGHAVGVSSVRDILNYLTELIQA
ncbi:MAG: CBS domain-containing protein [Pirellulaceae bacterium]|jgi:CBS domain-containing protein